METSIECFLIKVGLQQYLGKLKVMRSYNVGLKIVAVAAEDRKKKAKILIFSINFLLL